MKRILYLTFIIVLILLVFLPSSPALSEESYLAALEANPKVQSLLKHLVSSLATDFEAGLEKLPPTLLADVDKGIRGVRVIIEADKLQGVAYFIEARGGKVEDLHKGTIQAVIPLTATAEVANLPGVRSIRLPFHRILYSNQVTSEGVSIIGADSWHRAGWDGQGVKVAIIDDFKGYKRLLGEELPEEVVVRTFPEDLDIEGDPDEPEEEAVHGTGIAEIIYDITPRATLYLVRSSNRYLDEAVEWLVDQGVDVINTSWGLFTGCYGGDGLLDPIVKEAREGGILWVTSAGNDAENHWEGDWRDSDKDNQMDFSREEFLTIEASEGEEVQIFLSWDDPCGKSNNDYNLYLYNDDSTQPIDESTDIQNGDDLPWEGIDIKAPYSGTYHIVVEKDPAARERRIELFIEGASLEDEPVPESSMIEPASSPYALTVGATDPTDNTIRPYSSRGPTNDGRIKPDLAAPDCVSTATYGRAADPSHCIFSGFPGTSASAPHVTGAAALVKQAHPDWGPDQIQGFLEKRAKDLGQPGKDNEHGAGLLTLGSPPSQPTAQPPAAPSGLSAEAISISRISLSWQDNSDNEEGFKLERRSAGGDWAEIAVVDANTTEYLDTGLEPATEYCYRVRAFNAQGNSDYSNQACATTPPENHPPVADAGPDQTVNVGETMQLDGSGSHDPDGDQLSYRWEIISKPSGSAAVLSNSSSVRPSFVADVAGEYLIQLTVNDGKVDSEPDRVKITAEPPVYEFEGRLEEGKLGRVELPSDIKGKLPALVSFVEKPHTTLGARTSDSLAEVGLRLNEGTGTIFGTPTKAGNFNFLIAAERSGQVQAYIWALVTVIERKQPPVARFSYQPAQPHIGEPVTFDASASTDPDGNIVQYEWDFGDDTEKNYGMIVTHAFTKPGRYQVTLTVTDDDGLTGSITQEVVVVEQEEYKSLTPGLPERGAVGPGQVEQYTIQVLAGVQRLLIRLRTEFNSALNLYVRYGEPVVVGTGLQADFLAPSSWGQSSIALADPKAGTYYIAVENPGDAPQEFVLLATTVPLLEVVSPDTAVEGQVAEAAPGGSWLGLKQYVLGVPEDAGRLKVTLENLGVGRLSLHIRYGRPVEFINGRVIADYSATGWGLGPLELILMGPRLQRGKYYIAVENLEPYPQRFRLKISLTRGQEVR